MAFIRTLRRRPLPQPAARTPGALRSSVKDDNCPVLLALPDVDGALVGDPT